MNTYRVWMKNGEAGLYNANTPEDAAEQAVEWAMEDAYEGHPDSAWVASENVTIDRVELL